MITSKRAVLRTLAAALDATKQSYEKPSRGYRHQLTKEEHYRSHLMTTLRSVMANMAHALCGNDREEAIKLLQSLTKNG